MTFKQGMAHAQRVAVEQAEAKCPRRSEHTDGPSGYVEWHDWAGRMARTHRNVRCEGCGLWVRWVEREE